MSVEPIRSQLSDALDSRDVLRAANLLVGPEATAHAGPLFAWVNEATRNGREDLALELLNRSQVSAETRDYGITCVLNQLVIDPGRPPYREHPIDTPYTMSIINLLAYLLGFSWRS